MHWVFEKGQLERALAAYAERRFQEGATQGQVQGEAHQVRTFLLSPEAHKLTVRDESDAPAAG